MSKSVGAALRFEPGAGLHALGQSKLNLKFNCTLAVKL